MVVCQSKVCSYSCQLKRVTIGAIVSVHSRQYTIGRARSAEQAFRGPSEVTRAIAHRLVTTASHLHLISQTECGWLEVLENMHLETSASHRRAIKEGQRKFSDFDRLGTARQPLGYVSATPPIPELPCDLSALSR